VIPVLNEFKVVALTKSPVEYDDVGKYVAYTSTYFLVQAEMSTKLLLLLFFNLFLNCLGKLTSFPRAK